MHHRSCFASAVCVADSATMRCRLYEAQAQRPGVPSAAGMNGADATFDKPEEERTCKTKDLKQCPESAPGGLSLLFLDSLPTCVAFWQPLAYGSRTDLLMYCSDTAAGCVTTQCTGKDYGEVTVTNYFGASIDYIAAEYTNEWGHAICDKSTCGCFHSAVAAVPPVPHPCSHRVQFLGPSCIQAGATCMLNHVLSLHFRCAGADAARRARHSPSRPSALLPDACLKCQCSAQDQLPCCPGDWPAALWPVKASRERVCAASAPHHTCPEASCSPEANCSNFRTSAGAAARWCSTSPTRATTRTAACRSATAAGAAASSATRRGATPAAPTSSLW
jgi:hypothetical protein